MVEANAPDTKEISFPSAKSVAGSPFTSTTRTLPLPREHASEIFAENSSKEDLESAAWMDFCADAPMLDAAVYEMPSTMRNSNRMRSVSIEICPQV